MGERLKTVRHVVLDLDGTVYLSGRLFPWTLPFFDTLRALGIDYTFLTNNSSRSRRDYVASLQAKGLDARLDNVHTSGQATMDYLGQYRPELRRLFLLGTDGLAKEFTEAGYEIVDANTEPDAVVVAFDTSLDYRRLCRTAYWIQRGKPYLATHPDLVCPTDQPTVLIDCGAICACLSAVTGRQPDVVIGKPSPRMLEGLMRREGLQPHEIAVVGDRLYTDLKLASETGAVGVLVLSGETTAEQVQQSDVRPDLTVSNIGELAARLQQVHEIAKENKNG